MTVTKKYVRIKKATVDGIWYADKIGNEYEIDRENCVSILTKRGIRGFSSVLKEDVEVIVNNETRTEEADEVKNVNQTTIDSASTVFEKVGDKYIGSKSRFGDILIGAPYSEAFVNAYASERKDVLVIPKTIEYTAFLRSDEMKEVAKKSEYPNSENDDYPYGITDEDIQKAIKEARRDRAQARRDEIVEQAKEDVSDLSKRDMGHDHEFIINTEKRTVVDLRKLRGCTNIVRRGIAKCAPDDCFNVHIGKAIALRRALGLAVPDEYLNAPQPTEVRVGDVVRGKYSETYYQLWCEDEIGDVSYEGKIKEIADGKYRYVGGGYDFIDDADLTIIDDSREEVGGE